MLLLQYNNLSLLFKREYRLLFVRGHIVSNALSIIETEIQATPERDKILEFIKSSKRGIIRSPRFSSSKKNSDNEEIDNI